MNAAIEVRIECIQPGEQYYLDLWFMHPVKKITQIGKQYPTYIVFTEAGISRRLEPGQHVYRRGYANHDRR